MKKTLLPIVFLAALSFQGKVFGQQEAMYTQYMYNILSINPAYAGSKQVPTISVLHRTQWLGYSQRGRGAIETQTLNFHSALKRKELGVGVSLVNDLLFPINSTSLRTSFSYSLELGGERKLSFGINASLNNRRGNLSVLELQDQDTDPAFQSGAQSTLSPNVGFGAYLSAAHYYVGLSVNNLIHNSSEGLSSNNILFVSEQEHAFLVAGFNKRISKTLVIKPNTYIKFTTGVPIEMDLTTMLEYKELLSFGVSYRTQDAFALLTNVVAMEGLKIGYAFDMSYTNKHLSFKNGTHEIMAQYDFPKKKTNHVPKFQKRRLIR